MQPLRRQTDPNGDLPVDGYMDLAQNRRRTPMKGGRAGLTLERIPVELNLSLHVMRGHSASKTRVNALVTRASIFFRNDGLPGQARQ